MTEKRFVYYEHKDADYILDTPNTELDFIEMLGDALEPEEIVNRLNELNRLADGNEEQLLKVMSYLHDKHYDIWEEVNNECFRSDVE